jgi:hypothetical protein
MCVLEWFKRFTDGLDGLEDYQESVQLWTVWNSGTVTTVY